MNHLFSGYLFNVSAVDIFVVLHGRVDTNVNSRKITQGKKREKTKRSEGQKKSRPNDEETQDTAQNFWQKAKPEERRWTGMDKMRICRDRETEGCRRRKHAPNIKTIVKNDAATVEYFHRRKLPYMTTINKFIGKPLLFKIYTMTSIGNDKEYENNRLRWYYPIPWFCQV